MHNFKLNLYFIAEADKQTHSFKHSSLAYRWQWIFSEHPLGLLKATLSIHIFKTYTDVHTFINAYINTYTYMHAYMYTHLHTCKHTYTHDT